MPENNLSYVHKFSSVGSTEKNTGTFVTDVVNDAAPQPNLPYRYLPIKKPDQFLLTNLMQAVQKLLSITLQIMLKEIVTVPTVTYLDLVRQR